MKLKSLIKERINEIGVMRRSFPKMGENSDLGANFNKSQRAYDARMPDNDDSSIECPECGGDAEITKSSKSGKYYSYDAECFQCGHKWGSDNFP